MTVPGGTTKSKSAVPNPKQPWRCSSGFVFCLPGRSEASRCLRENFTMRKRCSRIEKLNLRVFDERLYIIRQKKGLWNGSKVARQEHIPFWNFRADRTIRFWNFRNQNLNTHKIPRYAGTIPHSVSYRLVLKTCIRKAINAALFVELHAVRRLHH